MSPESINVLYQPAVEPPVFLTHEQLRALKRMNWGTKLYPESRAGSAVPEDRRPRIKPKI